MSYENAINTKQMATSCVFCNRPLVDAESIERGCGPDCARKYGIGDQSGSVDEHKIVVALEAAPEPFRVDVAKYLKLGEFKGAVQRAIWHAAVAAEYGGEGAREVIASAHTFAQGAGFDAVARQIAKMHIAKSGIKLVQMPGGQVAVVTPYNPQFVAAIKNVPGRRFSRDPEPCWIVPEERLGEAVNALTVAWPGYMAFGTDGNLFAIPKQPVALPPPPTKPAGPPKFETDEKGPKRPKVLSDLKKGDIVVDPKGNKREVGWLGEKNGDPRVGLRIEGQRGYEFFSYSQVEFLPAAELAKMQAAEKAEHQKDAREAGASPEPELPKVDRPVPDTMFPYQIEGVRWLDSVGSGLLGDDMGLGKTFQAIVALDAPALVVCPATVRVNWAREVGKWRPDLSTQIISGEKPVDPKDIQASVVIVNYDVLPKQLAVLKQFKWATLVLDEAHYIKTLKVKKDKETKLPVYSGSKRAAAAAELGPLSRRRFLLTGTPILNRPAEAWPLLYVISPKDWPSFFDFGRDYCAGYQSQFGWDFSGSSNEEELHQKLKGKYMLRRMKNEVLKDLPEKSRQSVTVVLSDAKAKEYHRAAKEFLDWVAEQANVKARSTDDLDMSVGEFVQDALDKVDRAKTLTKMTALRKISAEGKVEAALEWVTEHQESTRRPLVVMGHHATALDPLVASLRETGMRVGSILGHDSSSTRQRHIDAFQGGELDVIVCSILAAGVGITLTAASEMLFIERAWRPGDLVQAEDRIYRIGQKNAVQITYMEGSGTIDEAIATLLRDKVTTIAAVIDGKAMSEEDAMAVVMGSMFQAVAAAKRNPGGGSQAELWPSFNWTDPGEM
jgi:SWI/SNF-related matrix-associated actin-dependent regulator of chromatin subfamily A-like protein 1